MNNLHRELAPVTDAAWAEIEDEARRTFIRHLGRPAGRGRRRPGRARPCRRSAPGISTRLPHLRQE